MCDLNNTQRDLQLIAAKLENVPYALAERIPQDLRSITATIEQLQARVKELVSHNKLREIAFANREADWKKNSMLATADLEIARQRIAELEAAQGEQEPIARLHISQTQGAAYLNADVEVLDGARLQVKDSPVDVYLSAPVRPAPVLSDAEKLGYELAGVIADAEHGRFDSVSLDTVKRVRTALASAAPAPKQLSDAEIVKLAHSLCIGSNASTGVEIADMSWTFDLSGIRAILSAAPAKADDARDAERYRFARQYISLEDVDRWNEDKLAGHVPSEFESAKADAAIDAAMQEQKGATP